jgi:Response regulators consisting of a CheY-like receiver domain and a winged-helix DNA-binding domain
MLNARILLVEDDKEYREFFAKLLMNERYYVDAVESALEAMEYFTLNRYDLIISDLIMEGVSGIQLFRYIKKTDVEVKTIILTADPTNDTEIEALDIYVDKYLVKGTPFEVLLKHIEHLLAIPPRASRKGKRRIFYEPEKIELDMMTRVVKRNDEKVNITTREFDVLCVLMENMGGALSREEIIAQIWDETYEKIHVRVIDVHIRSLRKKLKTQAILSIRGYGYKWDI